MDSIAFFFFFSLCFFFHVETLENVDALVEHVAYEAKEISQEPTDVFNQNKRHEPLFQHETPEKTSLQDFPGLQGESSEEDNNLFLSHNLHKEAVSDVVPTMRGNNNHNESFHQMSWPGLEFINKSNSSEHSTLSLHYVNNSDSLTTSTVPYTNKKVLLGNLSKHVSDISVSVNEHINNYDSAENVSFKEKNKNRNSIFDGRQFFNSSNDIIHGRLNLSDEKALHSNLEKNITSSVNNDNYNGFQVYRDSVSFKKPFYQNESKINFSKDENLPKSTSLNYGVNKNFTNFFTHFLSLLKNRNDKLDSNHTKQMQPKQINYSRSFTDKHGRQLNTSDDENGFTTLKTTWSSTQNGTFISSLNDIPTGLTSSPNYISFSHGDFRDVSVFNELEPLTTSGYTETIFSSTTEGIINQLNIEPKSKDLNFSVKHSNEHELNAVQFEFSPESSTVPVHFTPLEPIRFSSTLSSSMNNKQTSAIHKEDNSNLFSFSTNISSVMISPNLSSYVNTSEILSPDTNDSYNGSLSRYLEHASIHQKNDSILDQSFNSSKFHRISEFNISSNSTTYKLDKDARSNVDASINILKFQNAPYEALLLENASENSTIFNEINITSSKLNNISLYCEPYEQFLDICDYFTVSGHSDADGHYIGSLFLKKPLLASSKSAYQVKLSATDGMSTVSTTITVIVQRNLEESLNETVNTLESSFDNLQIHDITSHPFFSVENLTFSIPENFPPGAIIPEINLKFLNKNWTRKITFNLTTLDPSGQFVIEPSIVNKNSTLQIRLHPKASLDYEMPEQREFVFLIAAINQETESSLSNMVVVTVRITDVNDNTPEFLQDVYSIAVSESLPVGSVLLYVNATDKDSGMFGTDGIQYMLEGEHLEKFRIDSESGTLILAPCNVNKSSTCLDYEENPYLMLRLRAIDDGGRGLSTIGILNITLLDSNDNPPKFTQKIYEASIKHGEKTIRPPLFVKAEDADNSSVIEYIAIPSDNGVHVNVTTGEILIDDDIWLHKAFPGNNTITFSIRAEDGLYFDTASVLINLIEENNYAPKFLKSYDVAISDAAPLGTSVIQLSATDEDSTSQIIYEIEYGGHGDFVINRTTGVISVSTMARLDYEKLRRYVLRVTATDNGVPAKTGSTELIISLSDGNNKSPSIIPNLSIVHVKQGSKGEVIHRIHAEDLDTIMPLEYKILKPVEVFDEKGSLMNSLVSEVEEIFDVNTTSGEIRVISELSRDVNVIFGMTVIAVDTSADPPQTGSGTLIVTFMAVENYEPVFPLPWSAAESLLTVNVTEEVPVGTMLLSLLTPAAELFKQQYNIIPSHPLVQINETSGIVNIKSRIDYEKLQSFSFNVITFLQNQPSKTSGVTVIVNVLNINDNRPTFSQDEYHFSIDENSSPGAILGNITVKDDDLDEFGQVTLLLDGNYSSHFNILPDGTLLVSSNAILDREAIDYVQFRVIALDRDPDPKKRKSSSVTVYVTISDVNDNPPQFVQKTIVSNLSLNMQLRTPILQVSATDKDFGINGLLKYFINNGNEEGIFGMNETSGLLYIQKPLPVNVSSFILEVICVDENGKGPFKDEAIVTLMISQSNAHAPQFVFPHADQSDFFVEENMPEDSILLMIIKAEDLDPGENGRINYFFYKNGNYVEKVEKFSLNSISGELLVDGPLDREATEKYTLLLVAKDNGLPHPLQTVRLINVFVTDIDDNFPTFPNNSFSQPYSFSIKENEPTKSVVGKVKAVDLDSRPNAQIFYHIIDGNENEAFVVDPDTGIIRTNVVLDYEKKTNYILSIKASNKKWFSTKNRQRRRVSANPLINETDSSGNLSTAVVDIKIHNINDNVPMFIGMPYQTGMPYTSKPGEFVTQVKAIDPDGDNITYSLLSSHLYRSKASTSAGAVVPQPFSIDHSGKIYTARLLNSYNQDRFLLTVVAKEMTPPHHESKAVVEVWIYETSELIRVVAALPPEEVMKTLPFFIEALSNLTRGSIYIDDIRYHATKQKEIDTEGTDLYVHVVDSDAHVIKSASEALNDADSIAFLLPEYQQLRLTSIEPVMTLPREESFNPALAALIAVLIVLFVGLIVIIFICCANNYWIDYKKVNPANERPLSTITVPSQLLSAYNPSFSSYRENPLWIEHRKTKSPYEEQELSMHVFTDAKNRSQGKYVTDTVNSYSRVYPEQSTSQLSILEANLNLDDDYATLDEPKDSNDYSKKKNPEVKSEVFPTGEDNSTHSKVNISPEDHSYPQLSLNKNGEPIMIGELL